MEVRKVSIREAKKRIKNDPELSKMLVRSGWRDIALDLDGDGVADVAFASDSLGRKIDSMAVDLTGSGEFNLYLRDLDGNGIPDTIMLVEDGQEEMSAVAIGGAVELGFINLGVKIANLLVAEDFLNQEPTRIVLKENNTPTEVSEEKEEKEEDNEILTETLAGIYIKQGKFENAIKIIRQLSLKYPKKNRYFADQIRFLEKLIINNKNK